jgi:hypothetical protein
MKGRYTLTICKGQGTRQYRFSRAVQRLATSFYLEADAELEAAAVNSLVVLEKARDHS